jgi:lipid II:glycine glycyltransferase (peptidoglycan interpeptide bridge formation enzyme)
VASFPDPHVLQTWHWGQVKACYGWEPFYLVWGDRKRKVQVFSDLTTFPEQVDPPQAIALALRRSLPFRLRMLYLPKGPILRNWDDLILRRRVLEDLDAWGRQQGAVFIKVDPDVQLGLGIPGTPDAIESTLGSQVVGELLVKGWRFSAEQVQFRNTVLLDLSETEETLLAGMKQKARYNIRLAVRKGVSVRLGGQDDLELLYRMYAETSVRDGFVIREKDYYIYLWSTFLSEQYPSSTDDTPVGLPVIAEVSGQPVAALMLFIFGEKAWFLFGMSGQAHREKMPNYLVQWEAIRQAKAAGCQRYDLWGAPDVFKENDPLWGVYRFKEGLGGKVVRHIGAWDLPLNLILYRAYTEFLPRWLNILRRRGMEQTKRMLPV